jgi:hypothetical protein
MLASHQGTPDSPLGQSSRHDGPVADDDDIARLLREVEAMNAGSAPQNSGTATPAASGAVVPRTGSDVEPIEKEPRSAVVVALIAGGTAAVAVGLVFGVVPFVNRFGLLSTALGGFLGGLIGYGIARFAHRRKKGDG